MFRYKKIKQRPNTKLRIGGFYEKRKRVCYNLRNINLRKLLACQKTFLIINKKVLINRTDMLLKTSNFFMIYLVCCLLAHIGKSENTGIVCTAYEDQIGVENYPDPL